jgi:hypothetical protein
VLDLGADAVRERLAKRRATGIVASKSDPERDRDQQGKQAGRKPVDGHPRLSQRPRPEPASGDVPPARGASLGQVEGDLHEQGQRRCRQGPGQHDGAVVDGQAATMRSPKPPAPMKAAMVAVPTLITAAVLMPARTIGAASGSCTRARVCSRVRPSDSAACAMPPGTPCSPAWVLRTIGSKA